LDLRNGRRWQLRPGSPYWPFWLLDPSRRIPGVPLASYFKIFRLARAKASDRVIDCLDTKDALWAPFWRPLTVAALNTPPEAASAQLLWHVLQESFLKGESACRPMIARDGLAASFVTPAIRFLEGCHARLHLNRRLRSFEIAKERLRALDFGAVQVQLAPADRVICALPPAVAKGLLPEISAPEESTAIVNAHIRLDGQAEALQAARAGLDPGLPFLGLIGGTVDWIFLRGDVASLTVSAADALAARPNNEIIDRLWADTAKALSLAAAPLPPLRLIKEKRATFAQTPAALARRPGVRTAWQNLFLAGDWTDTGLPATIESAITSGHRAADKLLEGTSQPQYS
jgi:squalene-associated FAD-dependent desaturase